MGGLIVVVLLAGLSGGCGTSPVVLNVAPLGSHTQFVQTFTQAYTTRDAAGDYQIVLAHDPIDDIPASEAGLPLKAAAVPPVRQFLQIRVLWRPVRGAKADTPASTNAALHWYVVEGPTVSSGGMVHYAGTAFVAVLKNGPGAEVTIRNGTLKLVERKGGLIDPLGTFRLDGKFDAVADDARVQQVMADVKAMTTEQKTAEADSTQAAPGASSQAP